MRTLEELKAMAQHPTGQISAVPVVDEAPIQRPETPYRSHFEALEQLKDAIALHGTSSIEAQVCRRRVDRTREAALKAWKDSQVAA